MFIYFDNAASSPVCEAAANAVVEVLSGAYGNPSSGHLPGRMAGEIITDGCRKVAAMLSAKPEDIIFSSGGTESNNLAILGSVKRAGAQAVTSTAEHPSVLACFKILETAGIKVLYINPAKDGSLNPEELSGMVNGKTRLVSLSHVNHETGNITDIEAMRKAVRAKNPETLFHVDAVQSFGKHPVNVNKWNAELVSVSAHKLNGPQGVGALYVKNARNGWLKPLFHGGGQQLGLRPGTENVAGIAGFAAAVDQAASAMTSDLERILRVNDTIRTIINHVDGVHINGGGSPYIINMSFDGVPSEVMQNALDAQGIYVSAGAACNTRHKPTENVPYAYGLGADRASTAVRISLGRQNTVAEAEAFVTAVSEIINEIRTRGA